jgi:hypothetical protein
MTSHFNSGDVVWQAISTVIMVQEVMSTVVMVEQAISMIMVWQVILTVVMWYDKLSQQWWCGMTSDVNSGDVVWQVMSTVVMVEQVVILAMMWEIRVQVILSLGMIKLAICVYVGTCTSDDEKWWYIFWVVRKKLLRWKRQDMLIMVMKDRTSVVHWQKDEELNIENRIQGKLSELLYNFVFCF